MNRESINKSNTTEFNHKGTIKKKILVSQPKPASSSSAYFKLADSYNLSLDFRKFVKVVPMPTKEFRKHKANITQHTAIVFTSKSTVDHFFNLCKEIKIDIPTTTKYFCLSEQIAHYLQKYIQLKKRKVFYGQRVVSDLIPLFKKHEKENFLFPCSEIRNSEIIDFFLEQGKTLYEITVCKTIPDNLTDININDYGVITFFSPADVNAFTSNFVNFKQEDKILATFGENTTKALKNSGLTPNIQAPTMNAPSMAKALELYFMKQ